MTTEQKTAIIGMFNAACDDERKAEEGMDNAKTDRAWSKCANAHSFALGRQSAIDAMLGFLGFTLMKNDEDYAVDITEQTGDR